MLPLQAGTFRALLNRRRRSPITSHHSRRQLGLLNLLPVLACGTSFFFFCRAVLPTLTSVALSLCVAAAAAVVLVPPPSVYTACLLPSLVLLPPPPPPPPLTPPPTFSPLPLSIRLASRLLHFSSGFYPSNIQQSIHLSPSHSTYPPLLFSSFPCWLLVALCAFGLFLRVLKSKLLEPAT